MDAQDVGRSATAAGDGAIDDGRARPWRSSRTARGRGPVVLEASSPDDEVAAERLGAARHLLGDVAEPEQPERRAVQAARLRVLLLVPAAGPQVRDVVRDPAVEREDQAERELGDGDRVLARAVRDVDAARRRGGDVDRVVAGAGTDDEREAPGVQHRRGDLGASGRPAPRRCVSASAAASASSLSAGSWTTSQPIAARPSRPERSNWSATRTSRGTALHSKGRRPAGVRHRSIPPRRMVSLREQCALPNLRWSAR